MKESFKIICPVDFSECSLNALEFASKIGEKMNADLRILHVLNTEDYLKLSPDDRSGKNQILFVTEKLENLKKIVVEESLSKGLKSCELVMEHGEVVDTILKVSDKVEVSLVVAGTEGVNGSHLGKLGSRASELVENSKQDVLVVPRSSFFSPFQLMSYAQNYEEEDKIAIQKVVEMATRFNSALEVVHFEKKDNPRKESLHMTMEEELKPFARMNKVSFSLKKTYGSLAESIQQYQIDSKSELLITFSKKHNLWEKLFEKGLSKDLALHQSRPLWVIKSLSY